MKKFTENDIFVNTIKVYPKVKFFVNAGEVHYNSSINSGVQLNDFLLPPEIEDSYLLTEDGDILITEYGEPLIIEEVY